MVPHARALIDAHRHRVVTVVNGVICLGSLERIAGRLAPAHDDLAIAEQHPRVAVTTRERRLGAVPLAGPSRHLAAGLTNKQVAARLHISTATVRRHTINLYRKIGASGPSDAAVYATRHGSTDRQRTGTGHLYVVFSGAAVAEVDDERWARSVDEGVVGRSSPTVGVLRTPGRT